MTTSATRCRDKINLLLTVHRPFSILRGTARLCTTARSMARSAGFSMVYGVQRLAIRRTGYQAETDGQVSLAAAARWLCDKALQIYPDSNFAKEYLRTHPAISRNTRPDPDAPNCPRVRLRWRRRGFSLWNRSIQRYGGLPHGPVCPCCGVMGARAQCGHPTKRQAALCGLSLSNFRLSHC